MKGYNFITHGSTLINVEEVAYANLDGNSVSLMFRNNIKELNIHFDDEENALEFIRKICAAVGK